MNIRAICYLSLMFIVPASLWAHPGGIDSRGGHINRKTGEYHYHSGGGSSSGSSRSAITPLLDAPSNPSINRVPSNNVRGTIRSNQLSKTDSKTDIASKRLRLAKSQLAAGIENLNSIAENHPTEEAGKEAAQLCQKLEMEFAAINAVLDGKEKPEIAEDQEEQ
ncbi:MAG: YHYH domain-containing protein [Planctomycetaceae bacterium]|nr:YHYH domain-containing protein [Planctomycetaceae bacterium]